MSNILSSLLKTVISGFILLFIIMLIISSTSEFYFDYSYLSFFFRWIHVLSGVMWIGLLWYFNFIQIPSMPKIPNDQKPAISKFIAPEALFWFRWAALSTLVTGLILGHINGYLQWKKPYDWYRNVARNYYGFQCMGCNLAKPKKSFRSSRSFCRRKSSFCKKSYVVFKNKYFAFYTNVILHGRSTKSLLILFKYFKA